MTDLPFHLDIPRQYIRGDELEVNCQSASD